jgi:MFS transporter, DHA3 family, macrolide efflux protein
VIGAPQVAWAAMGAPVGSRSFRLVVAAHGAFSLAFWAAFGTMFTEATYRFDSGPGQMAVLGASLSVPFIVVSLVQGLAVDRGSPKWIGVGGYVFAGLALPVAITAPSITWLYAATFIMGTAWATVEPARSALTALLVPQERLVRANAILAIAFQAALIVGGIGSAFLIDRAGAHAVYTIALASALLAPVFLLGVPDVRQQGEIPSMSIRDLRAGAATTWEHPGLRLLLVVTSAGWILVNIFFVLEPLFVRETLGVGPAAVLTLWGLHGCGALIGATISASTERAAGRETAGICLGVTLVGAGIFAYAAAGLLGVAMVATVVQGFGFAWFFPILFAYIQRVVREDQRGRVTSLFVATQEAVGLLGSIAIFILGTAVPVRSTMVVCGAVVAVIGLLGFRLASGATGREPVVVVDDAP